MIENYEQLLREFARNVGLEPVEDFLRIQEVAVDDTVVSLSLEEEENKPAVILLFTDLGAPSVAQQDDVYRHLLEGNMLWSGTDGATLGLHGESGKVVLAVRHPLADLNAERFETHISDFVDTAERWREIVKTGVVQERPNF